MIHVSAHITHTLSSSLGGGAAWFLGVADLVLASSTAYAQVPFSALGLVPEQGSGVMLPESMVGVIYAGLTALRQVDIKKIIAYRDGGGAWSF
jgi:NADH:ubiquinone oxidoreductase subunit 4 (subunit M)